MARKKATFEVFHNKFIYGFVRRPVSLGKVAVEMEPLLTKSTIEEIFEVDDNFIYLVDLCVWKSSKAQTANRRILK